MAQSDNTMVLKAEDGRVIATASFSEELRWSIGADVVDQFLKSEVAAFQRFTDSELGVLSPADGEPQAVLLTRAAELFGWEVRTIQSPPKPRSRTTF